MLLIISLGVILGQIAVFIFLRGIRGLFSRNDFQLEPTVEKKFRTPFRLALMAGIWWIGLSLLSLPAKVLFILLGSGKLLFGAAGIIAAYRFIDIVGRFFEKRAAQTENKFDDLLVPLITRRKTIITCISTIMPQILSASCCIAS